MKCPNFGQEVAADKRFCTNCGFNCKDDVFDGANSNIL